ncbi:MAG: hypothetical protein NC238_06920 [Dehalobacter sp.]|nr:hypothetical protein [Dehalobacter sp.]
MKIFLLIVVFIAGVLIDVPGLIRKKYWRELVVCSFILLFAFIISLLQILGVKLPSPFVSINNFLRDMVPFKNFLQ